MPLYGYLSIMLDTFVSDHFKVLLNLGKVTSMLHNITMHVVIRFTEIKVLEKGSPRTGY